MNGDFSRDGINYYSVDFLKKVLSSHQYFLETHTEYVVEIDGFNYYPVDCVRDFAAIMNEFPVNQDFYTGFQKTIREKPANQRAGQAIVDFLYSKYRHLYFLIGGTDIDPYYDDSKISRVLEFCSTF